MKKLLFAIILCAGFAASAVCQSNPPLRLQEIDGSPNVLGVTTIKVTNGTLSCSGKVCTITISGGSSGITIGTTTANGTAGRVLYTDGSLVQAYAVTGSGNAVLSASPTLTGTVAMAAQTNSGTITQTSNSATAFVSGLNGATTPAFVIDNSTASQASGMKVVGKADGTAPELLAISRTQITTALAGNGLSITADPAIAGSSVAGAAAGGNVTITAGAAARLTSGNADGGNINLVFGAAIGTGRGGILTLGGTTTSFTGLVTTDVFGSKYVTAKLGNNTTTNAGFVGNLFRVNSVEGNSSTITSDYGSNILLSSGGIFTWNSAASLSSGSADLTVRRAAAANLAFGAADAAVPVAQTMSVQNVVAGTSNTAGANWTHIASRGTGTGVGGDYIVQVAPAGSSGTAQNTLVNAFTVKGNGAVQLLSVTFANLPTVANGYLIYCSDCTIASPCASGGSGALAKGINSAWVCN